MGRLCTPEEIANVALFLASDDSSHVSGPGVENRWWSRRSMNVSPAWEIGFCHGTLLSDRTTCSADDFTAALRAIVDAGVTEVEIYASHVLLAAGVATRMPPPSTPSRTLMDVARSLCDTNLTALAALDDSRIQNIARQIANAGCTVTAVDELLEWAEGPTKRVLDEATVVCSTAAMLGCSLVTAAPPAHLTTEPGRSAAGLAAVADVAAAFGQRIAVESLHGRAVPDLQSVEALVMAANRPNIGYLIDSGHTHFEQDGDLTGPGSRKSRRSDCCWCSSLTAHGRTPPVWWSPVPGEFRGRAKSISTGSFRCYPAEVANQWLRPRS
jgi:sugar phosphate isomerase/epimerase